MKYLGHIIGILGILLGCFFYLRSLSDPELVYYVDPAKLTVVRAGQSSKIIVKIDGDTVERDVTAAQIYIWNKGEDSIRKENLLSPLIISTGHKNPILDARIKNVSREIIGVEIDQSEINNGKLGLDWKILEQDDGFAIQLIYYGDENDAIMLSATVEKQGNIKELGKEKEWTIPLAIISLVLFITVGTARDFLQGRISRKVSTIMFFISFIPMAIAILIIFHLSKPEPPFM
jgi:hypothetical protein